MKFNSDFENIVLGGGCFWCLEPLFADLKGVEDVVAGYAGGHVVQPSYEAVCTGRTGHAEVVQVVFNPKVISLNAILRVFFSVHDPTTLNRQGADVGTQYRSIILYTSPQQKETAEEVMAEVNRSGLWKNPLVTQVEPLTAFYAAEEYHQEYFEKNPWAGYCQMVIRPKVDKFQKQYARQLKSAE